MHIRREIDNLLDEMSEIIAKNKKSNKDKTLLQEIKDKISRKTNNGKYAKGMWTDSPEFMYNQSTHS
jgi:hypothetical protein